MIPRGLLGVVQEGFALSIDGIHGREHWLRVKQNGVRLAKQTGANVDIVELFALLHDCRRLSDGRDPDHGRRAAELAASLRELWIPWSDHDFNLLTYACESHTDGLTEAHITVQTCWDADRLDLGRVGIHPDPERLCTAAARTSAVLQWAWHRSREDGSRSHLTRHREDSASDPQRPPRLAGLL
jgi:uncharacterized protein